MLADRGIQKLAALLQPDLARIEQHRILRALERRDLAMGILIVAILNILQDCRKIGLNPLGQQLL